mmetsp:Transcript_9934/g.13041  ORF Transcript_9934/g.13041 Transcript_9934/m.13041 type:complete len:84 (-) Transcript_9934:6-257(-)
MYLKRDVYGLCDVFEYFRELSMDSYGLDPAHYIGSPSFAWDSILKMTGVELEQIMIIHSHHNIRISKKMKSLLILNHVSKKLI